MAHLLIISRSVIFLWILISRVAISVKIKEIIVKSVKIMTDYTDILFSIQKSVPSVKIYIIRLALKIIIVLIVNLMID
jgi:hypothetical protein